MQTQTGMLHTLPFCVSHLRGWWKLCLTFNKTGGYSKYPCMYMLFSLPQHLAQSTHGFRGKAVELVNEVQQFPVHDLTPNTTPAAQNLTR